MNRQLEHRALRPARDSLESSSDTKPDAYKAWIRYVDRNFANFSIQLKREPTFQVSANSRSCEGFTVTRLSTVSGKAELRRGLAEIASDGEDRFGFFLPLRGDQELWHCNRVAHCEPESLTLVSMSEPLLQTKFGDNDTTYFYMPRQFVEERVVWRGDACSRPSAAKSGVWRLVFESIISLQRNAAEMSEPAFLCACRSIGELALVSLDGCEDLQSIARPVRNGNLARAKRLIRERLTDSDLTLTDIAQGCGISLRYLHDLFKHDGRTMSEYIQGERLRMARQMLENDNLDHGTKVIDVAMACGFSNASHFSTAFRKVFGLSPRDVLYRQSLSRA